MERARARGTRSGKAIGRPKVGAQAEAVIRASLLAGNGILKTAKLCGVSNAASATARSAYRGGNGERVTCCGAHPGQASDKSAPASGRGGFGLP
jgi:hypothetical protein